MTACIRATDVRHSWERTPDVQHIAPMIISYGPRFPPLALDVRHSCLAEHRARDAGVAIKARIIGGHYWRLRGMPNAPYAPIPGNVLAPGFNLSPRKHLLKFRA